jgi:serine protease Do
MKRLSLKNLLVMGFVLIFLSACSVLSLPSAVLPSTQQTVPTVVAQAPQGQQALQSGAPSSVLSAEEQAYIDLYKQVNPSVVHILVVESQTNGKVNSQLQIPGFPQIPQNNAPQQGVGSGFIYDTKGDIITNNHVVDGASKIEVTFYDGTQVPATVVGTDPSSDIAVIKVNASQDLLKPAVIGNSDALQVGQFVVAIGNPFGLQNSMSTGIVSGLGRLLPTNTTDTQGLANYSIPDMIQTDAAINPGNSGGPLLDLQGEVVGMNTAIESSAGTSSGVGYAIPSVIIKSIVSQLIQNGKATHPYFGIAGTTMTADIANAMNLSPDQHGVLVSEVVKNSPAEKAGLVGSTKDATINGIDIKVGGDVIVGVDNQNVKVFDDLLGYIIKYKAVGDNVTLHILRDGKPMDVTVTLTNRPVSQ